MKLKMLLDFHYIRIAEKSIIVLIALTLQNSFLSCSSRFQHIIPISISSSLSITPEGDLKVQETINVPASHRDLELVLSRMEGFVSTNSLELRQFSPDDTEVQVQNYQENINKEGFSLSWRIPSSPRTKTFELHYTLKSYIINHFDTAQLYYPCLQLSDNARLAKWKVRFDLPKVDSEGLIGWIRGRSSEKLEIIMDGELFITANAQAKKLDHYIQVLFPISATPRNTNKSLEFSLSHIIALEQAIDSLIAEYKKSSENVWIWSFIFLLLAFLYLFSQWCKNVRCLRQDSAKTFIERPPDIYSPAELGIISRYGALHVRDLVATLLHLAERGYFGIQEYVLFVKDRQSKTHTLDYRFYLKLKPWDTLMGYEQILMHSLFKDFSDDGRSITLYEIRKIFTRNPKKYHKFWKKWVSTLKKRNIILKLFDQKVFDRQNAFKLLGSLLFVFGLLFFFALLLLFQDYYYLIPLSFSFCLSGFFTFLFSLFFKKRSNTAEKHYNIYLSYRRYLNDLKTYYGKKPLPSIRHFETTLPYAVIWNIEENFLESLFYLYSSSSTSNELFTDTYYTSSLSGDSRKRIFQNITSMIQVMIDIFSLGSKSNKEE
jgi:hypothetical protein